jgi:RNA polymerase sigma-70 factor (ECF subfamily)
VPTPELLASLTERQQNVHRALDALPADQRELIERAYFLGSTQSEMAAQLDLPLGTVKTRIRNGLQALRALLDGRAMEQ